MQTTIVKWGNSQGVRIPKAFLQSIQIKENDPVEVILEKETIVIKKSEAKKHKTTKERLIEFYGMELQPDPLSEAGSQKEVDWGKPVGKEIW
jgi:antitoxin MazE